MRILSDFNTYLTAGTVFVLIVWCKSTGINTLSFVWTDWISFLQEMVPEPLWIRDRFAFVASSQLVLETAFWGLVAWLYVLERLGALERLQPKSRNETEERELTKEAFQGVLMNHWLVRPALMMLLWPVFELRCGSVDAPIPAGRVILAQIFACMMIDDTWFYWAHRLCHAVPFLYQNVHKKHHRFLRPNIYGTEYAHPAEDLFVNSFGTILGPLIIGTHPAVLIMYTAMKLYQSMEAHSGFNMPFPFSISSLIDSMDAAPAHDFHHSANTGNFGGWFMFWDWICGTDQRYKYHVTIKKAGEAAYNHARRPYENDAKWLAKLR